MKSQTSRNVSVARPAASRSAVSNGRRLFAEGDGRGPWARRFRDIVELHADDLGGLTFMSEAQMSLIRRAACIEVELEKLEGELANGGDVNLDVYGRSANSLRRILESLGIERVAKNVTPSLADIIARHSNPAGA
jgi:hypothetical protein